VRADQGAVDNYKLQLSYCRITAPVSGRVGIRLVDEGNLVHASDPTGLAVITQDRPIAVVFGIPSDALPKVQKAMAGANALSVEAYDRGMSRVLATGTVIALDNQIDAGTGTVRLKARFENTDDALFPNQFVNVRLLVETRPNATLLPVAAVQVNADSRYVFVVKDDGTADQRTVTVGQTEGDTVEVTKGVSAGETVVVEGLDRLQNGSPVTTRVPPVQGAAKPNDPPHHVGGKGRKSEVGKSS
jgi:membrane fusion protein, multidrug efflux system